MSPSPAAAKSPDTKPRLFVGLSTGDVSSILGAATPRKFLANTVVFHQGDPASSLYFMVEGRARHFYNTPQGQKMLLPWILSKDAFGIAALLPQTVNYLVSAETVTECSVLQWDRTLIRNLAGRSPKLLENAFLIAADHMHWAIDAHVGLLCHSARERLAQTLVNLAQELGNSVKDGIQLELSNEELADAASVTRFTASRLMSEWHRQGILVKSRGKVLLRSPEKLFSH